MTDKKLEKEKRTLTLESGEVIDCGVKEFEELKISLKENSPEKIARSTLGVLMSSNIMMEKLSEATLEIMKKVKERRK